MISEFSRKTIQSTTFIKPIQITTKMIGLWINSVQRIFRTTLREEIPQQEAHFVTTMNWSNLTIFTNCSKLNTRKLRIWPNNCLQKIVYQSRFWMTSNIVTKEPSQSPNTLKYSKKGDTKATKTRSLNWAIRLWCSNTTKDKLRPSYHLTASKSVMIRATLSLRRISLSGLMALHISGVKLILTASSFQHNTLAYISLALVWPSKSHMLPFLRALMAYLLKVANSTTKWTSHPKTARNSTCRSPTPIDFQQ